MILWRAVNTWGRLCYRWMRAKRKTNDVGHRRDIACYVPTLAQQQLTQQKNPSILFGVLFKEAVYVKPVHELIEPAVAGAIRVSKEIGRAHSELQSRENLVCRLLLEKKK